MTMAPTLSRSLARPSAVVDAERQESLHGPLGGPLDAGEIGDRPDVCPATLPIEDQRERAQQEFKQIWNLCTLTH